MPHIERELVYYGRVHGNKATLEGEYLSPHLLNEHPGPHPSVPLRKRKPSMARFTDEGELQLGGAEKRAQRRLGTICMVIALDDKGIPVVDHWARLRTVARAHEQWKQSMLAKPDGLIIPGYESQIPPQWRDKELSRRQAAYVHEEASSKAETDMLASWLLQGHGWPTMESEGGRAAADWAWSIAYRAHYNPGFMTSCLNAMSAARQSGVVPVEHYATLVDRSNLLRNKEQIYGTQYTAQREPWPIHDINNWPERHKAIGLTDMDVIYEALYSLPQLETPLQISQSDKVSGKLGFVIGNDYRLVEG